MGDKLGKEMEVSNRGQTFLVHFNVQTPLQIIFLNNFENCRSPSQMKPCTMRGPEMGKKD